MFRIGKLWLEVTVWSLWQWHLFWRLAWYFRGVCLHPGPIIPSGKLSSSTKWKDQPRIMAPMPPSTMPPSITHPSIMPPRITCKNISRNRITKNMNKGPMSRSMSQGMMRKGTHQSAMNILSIIRGSTSRILVWDNLIPSKMASIMGSLATGISTEE